MIQWKTVDIQEGIESLAFGFSGFEQGGLLARGEGRLMGQGLKRLLAASQKMMLV